MPQNSQWLFNLKKNNDEVIAFDPNNFLLKKKLKNLLAQRAKHLKKYIKN